MPEVAIYVNKCNTIALELQLFVTKMRTDWGQGNQVVSPDVMHRLGIQVRRLCRKCSVTLLLRTYNLRLTTSLADYQLPK